MFRRSPCIPTWLHGTLLAGQYTTPAVYVNVKAIFTNTVPVDAYRGAGRPEAAFILERLMSKAAQELGEDQAELRRKNFIQPNQFPYQTPVAVVYDIGDYEASLNEALKVSDYANFPSGVPKPKRKASSEASGSSWIEVAGSPRPPLWARSALTRPLRSGHGSRQSNRQRDRSNRQPQPRTRARDDVCAGGG